MDGPVICGIEDAQDSEVAELARALSQRHGLPLLFVHVLRADGDEEHAARFLREAVGGGGELIAETGHHPADRIVELAHEKQASFVVVGNHGPRSSLLGSVSADIARRASCPVVIVPREEALDPSVATAGKRPS
jgi:nucleotide-binding universal stress UspA family protein